ncbi:MAG TPA: hypothetical protein VNX68_04545 [Nitrosopumilaceae archaeon]|nr:hypothetical protein [Nitrosopumilaceae archaeon]
MEDKITEFKEKSSFTFQDFSPNEHGVLAYTSKDGNHSINIDVLIEEAIQFGSHLTVERAKEKVEQVVKLDLGIYKLKIFKALEESKI